MDIREAEMPVFPCYATVRIYLGPVEAKSAEEAEEIAENMPWPIQEWEDVIEIEAREP